MGNLYDFCMNEHMTGCQAYRGAMLQTRRWLLQNAYSEANGYEVKNPLRATCVMCGPTRFVTALTA